MLQPGNIVANVIAGGVAEVRSIYHDLTLTDDPIYPLQAGAQQWVLIVKIDQGDGLWGWTLLTVILEPET